LVPGTGETRTPKRKGHFGDESRPAESRGGTRKPVYGAAVMVVRRLEIQFRLRRKRVE